MSVWKIILYNYYAWKCLTSVGREIFFAAIRSNALTLKKGDKLREHLVGMINESSILLYISIYNITTFLKLKAFLLIFVIFLFQRIIQIIKLYIQLISSDLFRRWLLLLLLLIQSC